MTRRWLQSADVEIDDATGALLVNVGGADLNIDMPPVDVSAIVAGIAGGSPKTLADLAAISGAITDAPVNDNTTVESAAARTGISLWKRIINLLIAMLAKLPAFGTAGTPSADVITVQGHGSGAAMPVSGTITANLGSTDAANLAVTAAAYASTVRASSGETAIATTSDTAVQVIAADGTNTYHHLRIVNEGAAAGFYSIDGGTTWNRLPAQSVVEDNGVKIVNQAVKVKRVAGGSNVTSIYASAW